VCWIAQYLDFLKQQGTLDEGGLDTLCDARVEARESLENIVI
jgi:hypothetical protein